MIRIQLSEHERSCLEHTFHNATDRKLYDRLQIIRLSTPISAGPTNS